MTNAGFPRRSRLDGSVRHLHWFAAAFGITASFACAGFLISNPIGAPQSQTLAERWEMVGQTPGVSGTTFNLSENQAFGDQIVGADTTPAQPAAWNEIGTPGCLTITTENGQKLSFRIKGYRTADQVGEDIPVKVDLAVAACSQSSKQVVNAVLEPDASETVMKNISAEHSL